MLSTDLVLPDFFILGAAKAGTTSLFELLKLHPDVFMSSPKEPFFFEYEYEKGLGFYSRTYFRGWNGQKRIGEARVSHLLLPFVPGRIRASRPEARLIAILRDPVERAFSHWWMKYSRGFESLSFEDALSENLQRIESGEDLSGESGERLWRSRITPGKRGVNLPVYLDAGYYAQQLERYFATFDQDQICVFFFEDLLHRPHLVIDRMAGFLELDRAGFPSRLPKENTAAPAVLRPLHLIDRRVGFSKILGQGLVRRVKGAFRFACKTPRMKPETREFLCNHYRPHNQRLSELLGRSFDHWNV